MHTEDKDVIGCYDSVLADGKGLGEEGKGSSDKGSRKAHFDDESLLFEQSGNKKKKIDLERMTGPGAAQKARNELVSPETTDWMWRVGSQNGNEEEGGREGWDGVSKIKMMVR